MISHIFIFTVLLSVHADVETTSPEKPCNDDPQTASFLNRLRHVRVGEFLVLHDQMQQGDTLLKERLQSRYQHVREELKAGDAQLKEQLVSGDARLKEQLQEGDARLKEEISQDEQWLKDRLTKVETRVKEELSEAEANMKEELQEQKENLKKLQEFVKEWAKRNDAVVAQQAEDLSDMKTRLEVSAAKLQATTYQLQTTQDQLQTTQDQLQTTQDQLQTTQGQLQTTQARLEAFKYPLKVAEDKIQSLEVSTTSPLESRQDRRLEPMEMVDDDLGHSLGSTFVRWGRTDCPDNTSLVYSGVAGGSSFVHTGGASNPLCLVMDPQLDFNLTLPQSYTLIYGSEYEHIHGHHNQGVPCSICLAPQSSTIMVPATLTCPQGWAPQYAGYLMAGHHTHSASTEYVCVDKDMEDVHGRHENKNGYLFYYVATQCGSLPCPPYVNNKAVTCVVCSV